MQKPTELMLLKNKPSRKTIRASIRWKQALKIPSVTTLSFQSLMKELRPQSPHNKRIRNGRAIITPCKWNKTKLLFREMLFLLTSGARKHQRRQMKCLLKLLQILPCAIVVTIG